MKMEDKVLKAFIRYAEAQNIDEYSKLAENTFEVFNYMLNKNYTDEQAISILDVLCKIDKNHHIHIQENLDNLFGAGNYVYKAS